MGFNLDQKGINSFLGEGVSGGNAPPKEVGPDAETSRREALRLASTFSKLG